MMINVVLLLLKEEFAPKPDNSIIVFSRFGTYVSKNGTFRYTITCMSVCPSVSQHISFEFSGMIEILWCVKL